MTITQMPVIGESTGRSTDNDMLRVEYVPLDLAMLWEANLKKHGLDQIIESIERYGFKDPPKFEPVLNNGRGGIVEGNGRMEALAHMRREGFPAPRGIVVVDGQWLVPILFGVDAASEAAAEAYGIDHNNITLAGGDGDVFDMIKMWDDGILEQLRRLQEADNILPVSMDNQALDLLEFWHDDAMPPDADTLDDLADEHGEMPDAHELWPAINIKVPHELEAEFNRLMALTGIEENYLAFQAIINAVDESAL